MQKIFRTPVYLLLLVLFSCTANTEVKKDITDVILSDSNNFFYLDVKNYPAKDKSLPVGVFDSGTGGLTVLDAIVNFDKFDNKNNSFVMHGDALRDFQKEKFIYLGDLANMPYGQYSSFDKTDLLKEHVIKDVQFLLGNKYYKTEQAQEFSSDKSPVKALVIACNTATAYGKTDIENFVKKAGLDIKVIGVIGAGVRGALSTIQKDEEASVGVFATFGTVCSNGYSDELISSHNNLEYTGRLEVFQQAGVGLAGAIDGAREYFLETAKGPRDEYKGPSISNASALLDTSILSRYNFDWSDGKMLYSGTEKNPRDVQINSIDNYISYHVVSLLEQLIKTPNTPKLKAIILGCTHYPFYIDQFKNKLDECYSYKENGKYVYRSVMAQNISIIDPAENTAKELYEYLNSEKMFNDSDLKESEFYISVPNNNNIKNQIDDDGNFVYDYKYGRNAGEIQEYVKRVPFSKRNLNSETINMLSGKTPYTYELIKEFNNKSKKTSELTETEKL